MSFRELRNVELPFTCGIWRVFSRGLETWIVADARLDSGEFINARNFSSRKAAGVEQRRRDVIRYCRGFDRGFRNVARVE